MIKAILFDLDNTLVDFMKVKREAVSAAVDAMIDAGFNGSKEETVKRIFSMYSREGIEDQRIFDKLLVDEYGEVDHRILAAGILGYRRSKEGNMVLYSHVRTTLMQLLRMGLKLAILSDAPSLSVWMRLISLGLDTLFDTVVSSEEVGRKKPDPSPFRLALNRLEVEPHEAIMIGDWAERDIAGAKSLGMVTVFARYGDDFNTVSSGADYDINDIRELVEIVKKLNGEAKLV